MGRGHILIVDDDEDILTAGRLLLRRECASVATCSDPSDIPDLLAKNDFDVILLDMNFGPGESSGQAGFDWLQRILQSNPQMVVVMITAHGSVNNAVQALKLGALDFIMKPWQNEKVVATVAAATRLRESQREASGLRSTNAVLSASAEATIVGSSKGMEAILSVVGRAAPTDVNVLILGENGTGKELVARELHRQSSRADRVFLAVDLGSISESLFESELFGHRKGAFTGAVDDRTGRFQAANGGTLFLDEIGNLPLHLQAKLLRVLEDRRVTPLGSDKSEPVDVRIVAATNVPASSLRDPERFRQDLLFRLNTVEVTVPPLRDRRDDILPIAEHYLERYSRRYNTPDLRFSKDAARDMRADDWPGNVRALRHVIERAVILARGQEIKAQDLQLSSHSPALQPTTENDDLNLEQVEKRTISAALRKHGFNISQTAKELGLTRASLYRRMEKHGL